jgi:hypothetical protein
MKRDNQRHFHKEVTEFMAKKRKTRTQKLKKRSPFQAVRDTLSRNQLIKQAVNWPVYECLIAKDWRNTRQITQVIVSRRAPNGYIGTAAFVVDLGCLGIKNALAAGFANDSTYRMDYRNELMMSQPMVKCDLDLAAKVVEEAINYAASLGFKPHRDSIDARKFLAGANPQHCHETVPLGGENGKPVYVTGPYDDPVRIIRTLERSVGVGNFDVVVIMGRGEFDDDFDDFDDDDFDDFDEDSESDA